MPYARSRSVRTMVEHDRTALCGLPWKSAGKLGDKGPTRADFPYSFQRVSRVRCNARVARRAERAAFPVRSRRPRDWGCGGYEKRTPSRLRRPWHSSREPPPLRGTELANLGLKPVVVDAYEVRRKARRPLQIHPCPSIPRNLILAKTFPWRTTGPSAAIWKWNGEQ